jgi:hypothetical protein
MLSGRQGFGIKRLFVYIVNASEPPGLPHSRVLQHKALVFRNERLSQSLCLQPINCAKAFANAL